MGQVLRRQFLMAASALLASQLARAQAPAKIPTLGILTPRATRSQASDSRLVELGWFEGRTLHVERAFGNGNLNRLPALAAMLVAKKVDVIWVLGPEAAVAAARATKSIPIVFWGVAYPVEQGLVDSLPRPGRNVTGVAWWAGPEVDLKRLQFLREFAPGARRLAYLNVPSTVRAVAGGQAKLTAVRDAFDAVVRDLGFELRKFPVLKAADFEPAFAAIQKWSAQALLVAGTASTVRASNRITEFTHRNRLPAVYSLRSFVAAGGLISYGIDARLTIVRAMDYVDKILRGAKPADLPVELPQKYELAVNLRTAKALGLNVPSSIMLSADHVIE